MEIVLNFEKKQLVVKHAANIKALYKRLKTLLGKDLDSWEMVSDNATWYYPVYPIYPWPEIKYTDFNVMEGTSTIYGLSDAETTTAEYKIEGKDLISVLDRTDSVKEEP